MKQPKPDKHPSLDYQREARIAEWTQAPRHHVCGLRIYSVWQWGTKGEKRNFN